MRFEQGGWWSESLGVVWADWWIGLDVASWAYLFIYFFILFLLSIFARWLVGSCNYVCGRDGKLGCGVIDWFLGFWVFLCIYSRGVVCGCKVLLMGF